VFGVCVRRSGIVLAIFDSPAAERQRRSESCEDDQGWEIYDPGVIEKALGIAVR
jgi:hypothetical protein